MKLRWVIILLLAFSLSVYGGGKKEAEPEKVAEPEALALPDEAVASVNGVIIDESAYNKELQREREMVLMQGGQLDSEKEKELGEQILNGMIERELLLQESRRQGVDVSDEDIQAEFDQYRAGFPDEETFQSALDEQGFTQDELMLQIREYLFITTFINENVYESVLVSDDDISTFYNEHPEYFTEPEQVRARHILITFGEESARTKDEALSLAETLRKDLEAGADFAELASLHSDCPSSENGGDLGPFGRGQMVPEFEDAVFALEPGVISDVVETAFGFHIIEVTDKTDAALVALESVTEMIESYLKQEMTMSRVAELLADLRETGEVLVR